MGARGGKKARKGNRRKSVGSVKRWRRRKDGSEAADDARRREMYGRMTDGPEEQRAAGFSTAAEPSI